MFCYWLLFFCFGHRLLSFSTGTQPFLVAGSLALAVANPFFGRTAFPSVRRARVHFSSTRPSVGRPCRRAVPLVFIFRGRLFCEQAMRSLLTVPVILFSSGNAFSSNLSRPSVGPCFRRSTLPSVCPARLRLFVVALFLCRRCDGDGINPCTLCSSKGVMCKYSKKERRYIHGSWLSTDVASLS